MAPHLAPQPQREAYSNPYEGRWRWWYAAISDWMLDNPGGSMLDCARALGRGYGTISMIVVTDLFKAHFAIRRKEWEARRDAMVSAAAAKGITEKLHKVANASLDLVVEVLDKKRAQVPIAQLQSIAEGALDRLGYAPKPAATVTVNNTMVAASIRPAVTGEELEAARASYRAIQEKNRNQATTIDHQPAPRAAGLAGTRPMDLPTDSPHPAEEPAYDPLSSVDS